MMQVHTSSQMYVSRKKEVTGEGCVSPTKGFSMISQTEHFSPPMYTIVSYQGS